MEPHMQAQLPDQDLLQTRVYPPPGVEEPEQRKNAPANGHQENRDKQLDDSNN